MARQRKQRNSYNTDIFCGQVRHDNIIAEPIEQTPSNGKLVDPQQYEDKPCFGIVRAVGSGRILDNGETVPVKCKVGDVIFFEKYSAVKIRQNSIDYLIIREEDVRVAIPQD